MEQKTEEYLREILKKNPNYYNFGRQVRKIYETVLIDNVKYLCNDYPNNYDLGRFVFRKLCSK